MKIFLRTIISPSPMKNDEFASVSGDFDLS